MLVKRIKHNQLHTLEYLLELSSENVLLKLRNKELENIVDKCALCSLKLESNELEIKAKRK